MRNMDTSRIFLQVCLISLLRVECSLSDDFDVTTIYKFHRKLVIEPEYENDSSELPTKRNCSIEIHASNNAKGLPFISKDGRILDPNIAIDMEACTAFHNSCEWALNNFTTHFLKSPLAIQGDSTVTIEAGEMTQLRHFNSQVSFTFSTSTKNGALRIYLMEMSDILNEATGLYYFEINNRQSYSSSRFYKCYNYGGSNIEIAPGYHRTCLYILDIGRYIDYWNREKHEFFVTTQDDGTIYLSLKSNDVTSTLISWTDNAPLNIQYYKIGTTLTGVITSIIDRDDDFKPNFVLSETSGSIVSKAFTPRYNKVCVSVVYYERQLGSITLQAVANNGETWHLSQEQSSYLYDSWKSSVYSAQIPEESSGSPIRIELTAKSSSVELEQRIAIQRIAGCNSKVLEDIHVVSSNINDTEMDFHAYDVAVKKYTTTFMGNRNQECVNGGELDSTNSCVCPAGFTGTTCEIGCGPDRYDSKCTSRCSKTENGCMEMMLCRPKLGCSCSPGFEGEYCDIECSYGKYGASCKQMCGNCIYGGCDRYTGLCLTGCQEGFYPPLCQSYYKYLKNSPNVVSADYHALQVIFTLQPHTLAGRGTPAFYQIHFRDNENDLNTWTKMEPISLPTVKTVETNVTELKSGTNYAVKIVLLDIDGNSYQGKNIPVSNGFTKCIVPKVDYNLSTVFVEQKKFKVKWEYTAENSLWCKLTHFEVEMNVDWKWELHYEGENKTFTFNYLSPGEKYEVRVRGMSVGGPLPFSEPLNVVTQDEAPLTVSEPRITARKHDQLEVEWNEPFSSRGKIDKYKVTYQCQKLLACDEVSCSHFAGYVEVTTTSVMLLGLLPHAQYAIKVAAKSAVYGPYIQILATTDMTEPKVSPSLGTSPAVVRSNTTLTVHWARPDNCSYINGYLYGYQYELIHHQNSMRVQEGSTHNTSVTFIGLSPQTDYEVKVYLITSGGRNSDHPLIIRASTRATVPGKVEQLTIYKKGRHMLGLRWSSPKETYGDIRSFTISYKSRQEQLTSFMVKPTHCIAWPALYCYTITSLHPDTEYTLTVQARNVEIPEDGDISQVVATTKESAPLAPEYVKIVSQTETDVTIEWTLPKFVNGDLRSFLITMEQTDSLNTSDCCQNFPISEVKVQSEQVSYQTKLQNLKASSTYAVSVAAKTVALGPAVSITAHTRPSVPSMDGMLEVVDSAELSISSSPTVKLYTTSMNEDLLLGYLLVVLPQSADIPIQKTPITNEWLSQEVELRVNTTFYIADELTENHMEVNPVEVVLGKETDVKHGKWGLLWDPALKKKHQYRIGLIAILGYCGVLNIGYTQTDILLVNY